MKTVNFYPSSITQPNKNKTATFLKETKANKYESTPLKDKCFTEINGAGKKLGTYCKDQKDPKYCHEWSNTDNLKTGKTAQCGRPSKYHCNHKTYYSKKGYRNTCPIAGLTGTYVKPATLRLKFPITEKLKTSVKVKKVTVSFQHRRVGVNVANGKTSTNYGPNFSGFKIYPTIKVLRLRFVDKNGKKLSEEKIYNKNPPLANSKGFIEVNISFTDVTYDDLKNGYLEMEYGNNLSTNPGNIYIKKLKISVDYDDATKYIEGTSIKNTGVTSTNRLSPCITEMQYKIEAGYKQGSTKISVNKAPATLQKDIVIINAPKGFPKQPSSPDPLSNNATTAQKTAYNTEMAQYNIDKKAYDTEIKKWISLSNDSDKKTVNVSVYDFTGIPGKKTITFGLSGTTKQVDFTYTVKEAKEPTIKVINKYEYNTRPNTCAITVKNGCISNLKLYLDSKNNLIKNFTNIDNSKTQNILSENDCIDAYSLIAHASCGFHSLFIQIDNNPEMIEKTIQVIPIKHEFEIKINNKKYTSIYNVNQNKNENQQIQIKYLTKKNFRTAPSFEIYNPTYTSSSTKVGTQTWNTSSSDTFTTDLGLFRSGKYTIEIREKGNNLCNKQTNYINTKIIPEEHRQYFDELFVKFGYGTAVTYDYLVAWEGDTIQEPININNIELHNSLDKIQFCSHKNITNQIGQMGVIPLTITNNALEDVQNLYIELNVLRDDGYGFDVTTDEWLNEDGIFKNFKENFEKYNSELANLVEVVNLSEDNDFIDEENVYLKINFLQRNDSISLSLPFFSRIEKDIKLQLLLFENVSPIYPIDCTGTTYDEINIKVTDSILVDLNIFGNFDIFSDSLEIGPHGCPEECFTTGPITYFAKNIDTSNLANNPKLIIQNDPRLEPIQFIYANTTYNIGENTKILNYNTYDGTKRIKSINQKVHCEYQFPGFSKNSIDAYTNEEGRVMFFVRIPKTIGENYKLQDILQIADFTIEDDINYAGCSLKDGVWKTTNKTKEKDFGTYVLEPVDNYIIYRPGTIMPITLNCYVDAKYLSSELIFTAPIKKANTSASIQVIYKACNLDKNYGILETKFSTPENDTTIMPVSVSKKLYFGVPTNTEINTNLSHRVIEKTHMNRLQITIKNERPNKNVKVKITELPALALYNLMYYDVDDGYLDEIDGIAYWCIDYIEENTTISGNFDFKAMEVGLSQINIGLEDFLTDKNITFGEDSYKCECRKGV